MKKNAGPQKIALRAFCGILALLLALSVPVQVLAAEFSVADGDEMISAWETANNNSDSSNSFYLTDDVVVGQWLEANKGKTYDIYSSGNGNYTISEVKIDGPDSGRSLVNIHTDVTAQDDTALVVLGNAGVIVDGDVTTTSKTTANGNYVAVEASEGAQLVIKGDVNAAEAGIYSHGGYITVNGDVKLNYEGEDYLNHVIDADMGGQITVGGNVTSAEMGVLAMRDSLIAIEGDLILDSAAEDPYNSVISASQGGAVYAKGEVVTDAGGIVANEGTAYVGEDFILLNDDESATAIMANNKTDVTVIGDVISSSNGVEEMFNSKVTINGDLIADGFAFIADESTLTVYGKVHSDSYAQANKSEVDVYGDLILQSDDPYGAGSLSVMNGSDVWVGNEKNLQTGFIAVSGNSNLDAALLKADYVSVGAMDGDEKDTSKLQAYTHTGDTGVSYLEAGGSSTTILRGVVGDVYASQNAYVEIWQDAKSVTRTDKARVLTNVSEKKQEAYLPEKEADDYEVGSTTAYDIIDLCQGYVTGSALQKQYSELQSLLAGASGDIADKLNGGSAVWTSVFDHENINIASYMDGRNQYQEFYHNENYNVDSKLAFMQADDLNTYLISMYKDNLAQSLADVAKSEQQQSVAGSEEVELLGKIFAVVNDLKDAGGEALPKEQREFLKKAVESGDEISGVEMREFLKKFGYFKENTAGINLAAQRLSRVYNKIAPIMEKAEFVGKLVDAGVTVMDYVTYYMTDYTNQMIVLDEILANQVLSPEMYAAAAELRATMEDKMLGTVEKTVDEIKEWSVGAVKALATPLVAGQAVLDLVGLVTGGTQDAKDLQNGAALAIMAPQLLQTYENAVMNVKNGDTSEEAVRMVYMSYNMVQTTLHNMCNIMTNIGDKSQEKEYEVIMQKLDAMQLGEVVDLIA